MAVFVWTCHWQRSVFVTGRSRTYFDWKSKIMSHRALAYKLLKIQVVGANSAPWRSVNETKLKSDKLKYEVSLSNNGIFHNIRFIFFEFLTATKWTIKIVTLFTLLTHFLFPISAPNLREVKECFLN
jgi:hypothetical protein